jgi:hypothetical protein
MLFNEHDSIGSYTKFAVAYSLYFINRKRILAFAIIDNYEVIACGLIFIERELHQSIMNADYLKLAALKLRYLVLVGSNSRALFKSASD